MVLAAVPVPPDTVGPAVTHAMMGVGVVILIVVRRKFLLVLILIVVAVVINVGVTEHMNVMMVNRVTVKHAHHLSSVRMVCVSTKVNVEQDKEEGLHFCRPWDKPLNLFQIRFGVGRDN